MWNVPSLNFAPGEIVEYGPYAFRNAHHDEGLAIRDSYGMTLGNCISRILHILAVASFLTLAACLCAASFVDGAKASNIHSINSDLIVPEAIEAAPSAGRRVKLQLPEFAGSPLFHVLYLPPDWVAGKRWPVIVEYPGNGGFSNSLGDRSSGRVEDCKLGYGLSGGHDFIWVCLPFVDPQTKSHALNWWGDPDATAAYCRATVAQVCERYGGDPENIVLAGFSRGALACGYIGLRDDETAKLWRAFFAHSHFDGVRKWNYPGSDAESARGRLARLKRRPLFVSHETSVDDTSRFLQSAGISATLQSLPFPNHTAEWILKDIPERAAARKWLHEATSGRPAPNR